MMNKPPEKIYLQWEHYEEDATIYLNDVTWCVDKINEDDVTYVRVDLYGKLGRTITSALFALGELDLPLSDPVVKAASILCDALTGTNDE